MKRRFSVEEARDMIMEPTSGEMLDSETATSSEGESDVDFVVEHHSASSSDLSTESEDDSKDPVTEWTSKRDHVNMTNLNGRRVVRNWSDIDDTDVKAYTGLLILAGVYRSKGESTCSLWDDHSGRAIFRATMSHTKFRLINSTLRFDDTLNRPSHLREDKPAPFRSIWEMWTHRLPMLFNPGRDVCVDEQLVPFKGRCRFRQYMPSKPAKYGLKIWVTADVATSYAWKCQIYTGKADGNAVEVGQGKRVILEMTEELQGVTVTCDHFFTTYSLVQEHLKRKVALVGTIRKNKPELPPKLLQLRGRPVLSSVFAFTKTTTAVIGTYSCRRKTCRWPQVLFFNMIDVSTFNSFVLFTAVDPTWNHTKTHRRRLFLEELRKNLVSVEMMRRDRLPRTMPASTMVQDSQASAAAPTVAPDTDTTASSSTKKRGLCWMCTGEKKSTPVAS
ncbi:hypothetical protein L3Q82_015550, partial [Scortum barcoo]